MLLLVLPPRLFFVFGHFTISLLWPPVPSEEIMVLHQIVSEVLPAVTVSSSELFSGGTRAVRSLVTEETAKERPVLF